MSCSSLNATHPTPTAGLFFNIFALFFWAEVLCLTHCYYLPLYPQHQNRAWLLVGLCQVSRGKACPACCCFAGLNRACRVFLSDGPNCYLRQFPPERLFRVSLLSPDLRLLSGTGHVPTGDGTSRSLFGGSEPAAPARGDHTEV